MKELVPLKVRAEYHYVPQRQMDLRMAEVARIIAGALRRQQELKEAK